MPPCVCVCACVCVCVCVCVRACVRACVRVFMFGKREREALCIQFCQTNRLGYCHGLPHGS